MKLRATFVFEYSVPHDMKERQNTYGTVDPVEMAKVDNEHDPLTLVEACFGWGNGGDAEVKTFKVEPVEEA